MRATLKNIAKKILNKAVLASSEQRGEAELTQRLRDIMPDISSQYTTTTIDMQDTLLVNRVYCQHAFQMSTALRAIELLRSKNANSNITIVDIGDSAGTHLIYLKELLKNENLSLNALSVNLDQAAVDKINSKGLKAICCRAEELHLAEGGGESRYIHVV